ncbi:MAG: hypothetical protein HXS43_04345 [Theionarchaea archaeon]|nr:hypothetical protein [Theionarchaea archaeon]
MARPRPSGTKSRYSPSRVPRRSKRVRKLNMRRIDDFKWNLSQILDDVDDQNVSAVKGAIYAKASKIGVREAKDFIWEKQREGVLEHDVALRLTRLLSRFSVYR